MPYQYSTKCIGSIVQSQEEEEEALRQSLVPQAQGTGYSSIELIKSRQLPLETLGCTCGTKHEESVVYSTTIKQLVSPCDDDDDGLPRRQDATGDAVFGWLGTG